MKKYNHIDPKQKHSKSTQKENNKISTKFRINNKKNQNTQLNFFFRTTVNLIKRKNHLCVTRKTNKNRKMPLQFHFVFVCKDNFFFYRLVGGDDCWESLDKKVIFNIKFCRQAMVKYSILWLPPTLEDGQTLQTVHIFSYSILFSA